MSNYEIIELSNEGMEAISGGGTVNIDNMTFNIDNSTIDDINTGGDIYDTEDLSGSISDSDA